MSASESRAVAHARAARCDCRRARDTAARSPAGAPKRGNATRTPIRAAAHRAAAATRRPNGRRHHVPFDFDRPRA
ncbi:hypothetical protein CUJ89_17015 [Burkholderia pyrrocinia]|uniref:Uncharacterized protein n=1 Tax=Burkholderia pyrrocinia TaxID=60550 RepID=A0A2Z5MXG0_BURPY|nr:hypothetical protein CUJ89_17015 [Burkholderia pyrrocinia]